MEPVRRAVIDVGTNSIKLLVADVTGRQVQPVLEESKQTRLGSGFYKTNKLQPQAIKNTAEAVAFFADTAHKSKAESVRVIATSAARDAINHEDLTGAISKASGLQVEIISGEQEADWAFEGVTTDPALARVPLLLLDVGGGSTEFILGQGKERHFRHSFPLGTVRMLESLECSDPPSAQELRACRDRVRKFLETEVSPKLEPAIRKEVRMHPRHGAVKLVGTGGTASILARMELGLNTYDRDQMEAARLTLERVHWHTDHLWSLPLEQRKKLPGLPPNRADVILPGTVIYELVLEVFEFVELQVSTRGLRFAVVLG